MRLIAVVALVVCAAPFTASAKPFGEFRFIVTGPGDETDPSIDGQYVVFAGPGPAADGVDVLLYDTASRATQTVAGGAGDQHEPDVSGATAAYVTPRGVAIEFWATDTRLRAADGDATAAAPAVGADVAAWETGQAGGRDVVVSRYGEAEEYRLERPGDQRAPAAFGSLVAYVDGADRDAVWLHDSADGSSVLVCAGAATSVAIAGDGKGVVVAVARASSGQDDDIEVYDGLGRLLTALRVAGVQRNPHVAGDWVAFEDVSTRYSQVVLWRWRGEPQGLVFLPRPSETDQKLNDLSFVAPGEVRVVFEDSASLSTGRDIALYTLEVYPEITFDDQPNGYPFGTPDPDPDPDPDPPAPAECDDPDATVLATLALGRDTGKPLAGTATFTADLPDGALELPVLVCIDSSRVSAAWVTLDDEAIATPSDFEPAVVHLELAGEVRRDGRISGVLAGKPGASLVVRVLADPARAGGAACDATGEAEPAAATADRALEGHAAAVSRCGAGPGGALSLAALAFALALARRRNRRS